MIRSSFPTIAIPFLTAAVALAVGCSLAEPTGQASAATPPPTAEASSAEVAASAPIAPASVAAPAISSFAPPSLAGTGSASSSSSTQLVSAEVPAEKAPCPEDMVLVGRFCVDRHEAFLKEVGADGSLKTHPYYERPVKGVTYAAANEKGAFPQAYISRVEAKAACTTAGKRLCSRAEFQRACRNKGWMLYPYGNQGKRGACNTGKGHLLTEMFGKPARGFKYDDHFNSPELSKTPGFLAKSGEYEECGKETGIYDMVGNLHEWVSDTVDEEFIERFEAEEVERRDQPKQVGNGMFIGGFYSTTNEHGPGCTYTTVAHEPTYHDYSTGFRCCKAADLPKPAPKAKPAKPTPAPKTAAAPKPASSPQ